MSRPIRQPLTLSDARREAAIRAAAAKMAEAYETGGNSVAARAALHVMTALIAERSHEQIRRMERATGLSAGRGDYSEKLQDPRWQRKRLEIMQHADFSCERCGAGHKPLHVHHKFYELGREPWEYADKDFECLCEDCHEGAHRPTIAQTEAGV